MTLPPPLDPLAGGGVPSGPNSTNPYAPPTAGSTYPPYPPPPSPPSYYGGWTGGPPPYPQPGMPGVSPTQQALLYPGAPATLVAAVAAGKPVQAARWGIPDAVVTGALWFFFSLLSAGVVLVLFGEEALASPPPVALLALLSIPWIGLAGWPLLVAWWRGNGPVIDFGYTWRLSDLGWGVLYGGVALVGSALIAVATTAAFGDFDSAVGELVSDDASMAFLIVFGILVGIGAPLVEELAFRGLVFGALAKRGLAPWLTIGLSGLIFALFHFEPIRAPLLLWTGLVLGLARFHRGSTTVATIAHMSVNLPAAFALIVVGPESL